MLTAQFFPDAAQQTLREAVRIMQHRFSILGSREVDFGPEIDWHWDFVNDYRWPLDHHTRLQLTAPKGGRDVKIPWELSRFHHALRLGQAYLYTSDERYAQELVDQVDHWIRTNPYEFGVNWAGPMDVAIRAINWMWAMYFIFEAKALTDDVLALWLTSLEQHGEYLERHLEDGWPQTNHLIANLAGLAYIGILFPEFAEAENWQETGLTRLWQELERQINPDGFDYEASTGYHRLVTEIVLHVVSLCVINYIPVPETALARIYGMLDAIMLIMQPNGTVPQIGDFDNGRLLPLSVHADLLHTLHDYRHLLGLGSIILERESPEWAGSVDPTERGWSLAVGTEWQDAFWLFASDTSARYTDTLLLTVTPPEDADPDDWVDLNQGMRVRARALSRRTITVDSLVGSVGLEASGLYVMQDESLHMVIDAGGVGTQGVGGHAHNDILSMTLHAFGQQFLTDPGSYTYTAHPAARNAFRSTAFHNTLQINGEEINPIPSDELFALPEEAHITVHRWVSNNDYDLLDASHNGYARLSPGVIHRRQILFDKRSQLWILRDTLEPVRQEEDMMHLAIRFHLMPMKARAFENGVIRANTDDGPGLLIVPFGEFALRADVDTGWYAPGYGQRREIPVVTYEGAVYPGSELILMLYPRREGSDVDIRAVYNLGETALIQMRKALNPGGARFARP